MCSSDLGGGNDIASLTRMIVSMMHEKRRFVEAVDFVTSTGFWRGGASRAEAGLIAGGPGEVVTDLAILGFDDDTKRMKVQALHAGVSADRVRENTGFELLFDADVETTEPPTADELAVLREVDPDRVYIA